MEILALGEKIKRRRKDLDMTLKDLAGERITPGQISLVESGKSNPSMDLLEYLAETLHTSVEYLMETEDTQAEKICLYYENIAESYILNDDINKGEQFLESAMFYAERYHLDYRKARNLYLRAMVAMGKKEMGLAQQLFLAANTIFIRLSRHEEVINTYLKLGIITLNLEAYHSSNSYFQQAEKIFQENDIGNDFLLGQIYYYIALVYFKLEDIEISINYSYLAKKKFEQINNKREYALTLLLISKEYINKQDIDNAIKYSEKSLKFFKESEEFNYIGEIENELGRLFYQFDNIEESFIHLNKAKEIRMNNNDPAVIDTLINICENYIKLKDINNSKIILKAILDAEYIADKSIIKYYLLRYRINILDKNLNEAEESLLIALEHAQKLNLAEEEGEISIAIGKFYLENGNDRAAAKYLDLGIESFKKTGILRNI